MAGTRGVPSEVRRRMRGGDTSRASARTALRNPAVAAARFRLSDSRQPPILASPPSMVMVGSSAAPIRPGVAERGRSIEASSGRGMWSPAVTPHGTPLDLERIIPTASAEPISAAGYRELLRPGLMQKIRRWLAIPGRRHPHLYTESFKNVRRARRAGPLATRPVSSSLRADNPGQTWGRGHLLLPSMRPSSFTMILTRHRQCREEAGAILFWRRYYNRHEGIWPTAATSRCLGLPVMMTPPLTLIAWPADIPVTRGPASVG